MCSHVLCAFCVCSWSSASFGAPDLVIQDLWSSPDPLVLGSTCTVFARVLNQGDATANTGGPPSDQRVYFFVDGIKVGEAAYDTLAAGSNVVVSTTQSNLSYGSHEFRADADAENRVEEGSNEGNNSRAENWNVTAPDIVVAWIAIDMPNRLSPFIRNSGNAAACPFSVAYYRNGRLLTSYRVSGLKPGEGIAMPGLIAFVAGTYKIFADIDNEVFESNEENNGRYVLVEIYPWLAVNPMSLFYGYTPPTQIIQISNRGEYGFSYTIKTDQPWLTAFPTNGTCESGETNLAAISVDVSSLTIGTHTGRVAIVSTGDDYNLPVTVTIADNDYDQIPDGWENKYFGGIADCKPLLDTDLDGQNNFQEWIAGTDPTNKDSAFSISSVSVSTNALHVFLTWPTLPNRQYDVYRASNIAGPYLPLGSNLPFTRSNYSDTSSTTRGFYRVNAKLE